MCSRGVSCLEGSNEAIGIRECCTSFPDRVLPVPQDPNEDRSFHTVITAEGTATHWQSRIGYYHFLKAKQACQKRGSCQMVRAYF